MPKMINADTLDGLHASTFAFNNHNHDGRYSLINHLHDERYAIIGHVHDDRYALRAYVSMLESRIDILEGIIFGTPSSS